MKKIFFLALLSVITIISAQAQRPEGGRPERGERRGGERTMPTPQEMADKETERQTKMLNLTPEQVAKAKVINLKYSQQRADLMKEMQQTKDRASIETKMQGIKIAQDNELKSILTADQQTKLTQVHGKMEEHKGDHMGKMKKPNGTAPQSN